jgi:hypothetical protein
LSRMALSLRPISAAPRAKLNTTTAGTTLFESETS